MFEDLAAGAAAERPALVNLVVNQCQLTVDAYPATISDLAARGYLAISEHGPGNLMFGLAELPPHTISLAGFERRVLGDVSERLAAIGNAPLHVLADACLADVSGRWEPFEASVRAEARNRGLMESRLNAFVRRVLRLGALGLATAAYLGTAAHTHSGHWPPLIAGFLALVIPMSWISHETSKDRLSAAGTALAARSAALSAAWAPPASPPGGFPLVADAGTPGAGLPATARFPWHGGPDPVRRNGPGGPDPKQRPTSGWSSMTGTWRQVAIGPAGVPLRTDPTPALIAACTAGVLSFPMWVLPGTDGVVLPLALLTISGWFTARGLRHLARWREVPAAAEFDGQVIARWIEHTGSGEDARDVLCLAIDDGNGAWSLEAGQSYSPAELGDLVHICVKPRSMTLVSATVISPAAAGALAGTRQVREPLLSAAEISDVFGTVVDGTHFSLLAENNAIYRNGGTTLSVTTARGRLAGLSRGPARSFGRPLPGLGDAAWLVNGDRTVVVQVGDVVAKLTLSGTPIGGTRDPRVVIALAATVVARLAARAGRDSV